MNTRHISSIVARVALGAVCVIASASCGSDLLRTGRAPVYATVQSILIKNGATNASGANLLSDVQTLVKKTVNGQSILVPTIFDDTAVATIQVISKNPTVAATDINSVTFTRYHIEFKRIDGRNTPGVDVPYGWDGGTAVTIPANSSGGAAFEIVRHSSKEEPPLRNLIGSGGLIYIYTIAQVTFYGHDQNGNEVIAVGQADVAFSDFGDPE